MNPKAKTYLYSAIGAMVVIAFAVLLYRFINDDSSKPRKPVPEVVTLKLIQPPPLPPPPPPPPPKVPEVKMDSVKPTPTFQEVKSNPTPSPPSPANSAPVTTGGATGAGDSFGLGGGAGGGFGGTGGNGNGEGGNLYGLYTATLESHIKTQLTREADLHRSSYQIAAEIWIKADGSTEKASLIGSTGNEQIDQQLMAALNRLKRMTTPPPAGMPQPIVVQIRSS